jgi:membrane fusion protein, multidrug efflux system
MAAARDQAARVLRPEAEIAGGDAAREASRVAGDSTRPHHLDETPRRPAEVPELPPVAKPASSETPATPAASKVIWRKMAFFGLVVLLALAAVSYGVHWVLVGRFYVATDDAYVRANNTTLGARVAGHIAAIFPHDNAVVHAGEVIFKIDDGDYRIALDDARAKLAVQQATVERAARQVAAQQAAADQAEANLASANAGMKRSELDYNRQQELVGKGVASHAVYEQSEAARNQGLAAVHGAEAAVNSARVNVEVTKAQQVEAAAQLKQLETQVAKAERDLDFTSVRSSIDGVFSNRLVGTGDFIAVGQRLGNVVPLDEVFIDANFKETQLKRIRPGQPVTISVDAYGHRKFAGTVESISPAAGSVFTLLPPDNATGNFTKIVQRLPVRVRVPKDVARQNLLRAGMSVYVTVDTTEGAKDAESDADLDAPAMVHPQ